MQVTPTVARMGGHQTSGVHQVSGQRTSAPPQEIEPVSAETMPFKATPTTLEIGIPGGAHGWLKVRAEISGDGTISASLASGSQSGQQMLHRELPSLTAFLQSESVKVGSLSVHLGTPLTDQSVASRGSENSGDLGQHKGSAQGDDRQPSSPMGTVKGPQASRGEEWNAAPGDEWILSAAHSNSGGWLSVMA
ncbi:hypothetical protein [Edaphobacter bradus]|uniref:hypothetical protein n=1 Tax=Edaphobacter bradus TaxID=2259016 RepID=UPI0021E000A0|nr:hypothetical protein [Edaphobacter bradus]